MAVKKIRGGGGGKHLAGGIGSEKATEPIPQKCPAAPSGGTGSAHKTEPIPKRRLWIWVFVGAVFLLWLFCLPRDLFKGVPYSTVVESCEGELLGARIAADGQWRFPQRDTVPERFASALVQFEDRHFWWHPGVDLGAVGRALRDNVRYGHVVSGGSTITMQVIRLSRGRERTLWQKVVEAFMATRLEARCTKRQILALYASNAPFGGNVVGLDAASWRYFGRPAEELSWAEAATLAVLPNAPSAIHPGKGREELLAKRNRLLARLLEHGDIDNETYSAAVEEPLPGEPLPLPSYAAQFVDGCPKGVRTVSSIRFDLQRAVEEAVRRRSDALAAEGVADMAAVVMDNASGEVVAYVGNSSPSRNRPGVQVDIASAPRSTGSILKPFLYAAAVRSGTILPGTLLPDVPVNLGGFAPQNFDRQFYGAVPASEALARSLNVPSVFLLRKYGVERFYEDLQRLGLTTLTQPASHYGLSLILGGAEGRLTEITAAYSSLVRTYTAQSDVAVLKNGPKQGRGGQSDAGVLKNGPKRGRGGQNDAGVLKNGQKRGRGGEEVALWYVWEALKEVNRPDQLDWRLIGSVRKAAWKTGTSYGFRDAWAVGMTPEYTIGVWAGNADGSGVPGLTGARAAGPAMFDILNLLPESKGWFQEPDIDNGVVMAEVCAESGYLAGAECTERRTMMLPEAALDSEPCPYHHGGTFTLPPTMEWYYRPHHPEYTPPKAAEKVMEFIYPQNGTTITIPGRRSGEGAVFRVAHRRQNATLWWHLDGTIVGETRLVHSLRLGPGPGQHTLTVVDDEGESATVAFAVR